MHLNINKKEIDGKTEKSKRRVQINFIEDFTPPTTIPRIDFVVERIKPCATQTGVNFYNNTSRGRTVETVYAIDKFQLHTYIYSSSLYELYHMTTAYRTLFRNKFEIWNTGIEYIFTEEEDSGEIETNQKDFYVCMITYEFTSNFLYNYKKNALQSKSINLDIQSITI